MDIGIIASDGSAEALLQRANALAGFAAARAAGLDREAAYPAADMRALAEAGLLGAVLPPRHGGVAADDAAGGRWMLGVLHAIGRGSLAVGRLFEAHVNAMRLVMRYGTAAQRRAAAARAAAGQLFALWVTDPAQGGVRMAQGPGGIRLTGGKGICSGAGHADHAIITAEDEAGDTRLLLIPLHQGERVAPQVAGLQGMRAATSGAVDFTGCAYPADALIGGPGDYLREPEFSTGAWRSSAVALGGLAALLDATRSQLIARGRDGNPHQRARLGRVMIAHQTGWLWLQQVAELVHDGRCDPPAAVATVNLARIAVESGCVEAIAAVQRSLGLAAFVQANPVERLCRDLATYLRQPAPDEALDEAVGYFMTRDLPGGPR